MKLKGIGRIEQHIEKIVLAVFAIIFLGVFVLQFDVLGDPNAVEISGRKVSPENAAAEVSTKARQLQADLDSGRVPSEFPDEMPSAADFVRDQLDRVASDADKIVLGPSITPTGDVIKPIDSGSTGTGSGNDFIVPEVPAPANIAAAVFEGSLHPLVIARTPEAAQFVGAEQPYDFAAVTVQGEFDAAAFRNMLRGTGNNGTPMPGDWTRSVELVDVVLVRERLTEDGDWVEPTEIAPMPGRYSARATLRDKKFVPANLPDLYKAIAENTQTIRRPAPYDMIMGAKWIWPALSEEVAAAMGGGGEVGRLLERKKRLQREMDDDTATLETLRERLTNANDRQKESIQRQIETIETRMTANTDRMTELDEQLTTAGVDPQTGRLIDDPRDQVFEEAITPLMTRETETITVWGHDYTAKRGQTYRYAIRAVIMNPMFGHRDSLSEAQKPLADSPVLDSPDSEWSAAIEVPSETYLFVADAAPPRTGAVTGPAQASIEMYRFYYGYWRRAKVDATPGDAISASVTLANLATFEVIPPADDQPNAEPTLGEATPIEGSLNFASGDFLIDVADAPIAVFVSRNGRIVRLPIVAKDNPVQARLSASVDDGARAEPPKAD